MTNLHWYLYGLGLGTFKYIPAHFFLMQTAETTSDVELSYFEIFIPTYIGSLLSMAVFYFTSDYLMERAAKKRHALHLKAIEDGVELKRKKIFTKMNKMMVNTKRKFGIYAFTFIVPLIFSIPLGSILCAKFYGHQKHTYPLMALNMALYGMVMSAIMLWIYG